MMNDAEANLFEVFQGYADLVLTTQSVLITVIFAFLIAVYLAGAILTRFQLALVTFVYSIFFLSQLFVFLSVYQRMVEFAQEITQLNPNRQFGVSNELVSTQVGIFLVCYIVTLLFMFQIRRHAKKKLEQA